MQKLMIYSNDDDDDDDAGNLSEMYLLDDKYIMEYSQKFASIHKRLMLYVRI